MSCRFVIMRNYIQSCILSGGGGCRFSLVGIATRYGQDGLGIETRWRRDFPLQSRPALGPTMDTGSFPGVKRSGPGVDHPTLSTTEVEGRVELYIYSPSGPSWPVLGKTLHLLNLHFKIHEV